MKKRSSHISLKVLGQKSSIYVGQKNLLEAKSDLNKLNSKKAFLVWDRKLVSQKKSVVRGLKKMGWKVADLPVTAGESLKDIKNTYPIFGKLLKLGADRNSVLFALGGGSVGDAAGFIAATYLRGIQWVGLPTTLLAQVDSSVGGKTGINHTDGKNLIGSFHMPRVVICDVETLKTLSRKEVISGLCEAIKYGLVFDKNFYRQCVKSWGAFLKKDQSSLIPVIARSLTWKCHVVAKDFEDRLGAREKLNFGHTFGHALEAVTGYKKFQHGEAVLWGMRFALALSEVRGHLSTKKRIELDDFLKSIPVPKLPPKVTLAQYQKHMQKDKKKRQGKIHFVLLDKLGKTVSDNGVKTSDLQKAFKMLRNS